MRIKDSVRIDIPWGIVESNYNLILVDGVCRDYWIVFSYDGFVHYHAGKYGYNSRPDRYW